jgi:hypothetical protein
MIQILILLLALFAAVPAASSAVADEIEFSNGSTPIKRSFSEPVALPVGQELVISGTNPSDRNVTFILRFDDGQSSSYATRVDIERVLPPGPFVLRYPTSGQRTPTGRVLNTGDLRRFFAVVADGDPQLHIDRITVEKGLVLPPDVIALDFGPPEAPVYSGFQPIYADDHRLKARSIKPIRRPGPDALIGDGLIGIERIELNLLPGHWRVTLWNEDPGEWEYMPHPIQRRIRLNGKNILYEQNNGESWVRNRYLAGGVPEALVDGDPWAVFGERRGGMLSGQVDLTDGHLVIELAGDAPATFVAAMVIEPAGGMAWKMVQDARAQRFRETWRVEHLPSVTPVDTLLFGGVPPGRLTPASRPDSAEIQLTAAAGTAAVFDLIAVSPVNSVAELAVEGPANGAAPLPSRLWAGQWQYERPSSSATLLTVTPNRLRADFQRLQLKANLPRRYTLRVEVPDETPPGRYRGSVSLRSAGQTVRVPIILDVPTVKLPPIENPIGVYLEVLPLYNWFADLRPLRREAMSCDMLFLRSLGLTGISPPLTTPLGADIDTFIADMATVEAAGFAKPALAYAPAKRVIERVGNFAGEKLAEIEQRLRANNIASPAWAIADEPSNPGSSPQRLIDISSALRAAMPTARLAGQLNAPADEKYLKYLDIALVNMGFGVDAADLKRVRQAGATPWFYNMGSFRLAAGFYFWRVGAEGYLQWHGRSPTADPFDPTDGREADIQMLYPSAKTCPTVPDIHANLLQLAEGINDLRWLKWLDSVASTDDRAIRLRARLLEEIPDRWEPARQLDPAQLDRWRQDIMALAR